MGKESRRVFTDEFKQEAVRLTETSGRTIAQVAADLGIGLSSLTRWRQRYREADLLSGPHEDVSKELARLRRENEILRSERDLLKKRPLSSSGREVDEVSAYRCDESGHSRGAELSSAAGQPQRLLFLKEPGSEPPATPGSDPAGAYPRALPPVKWNLWQSAHVCGSARGWTIRRPSPGGPPDAGQWPESPPEDPL